MKLQDDDYTLEDGAGWFDTAGYAVRIFTDGSGAVHVHAYKDGDEMGETLACFVLPPNG